jgi:uncharacterized protein YcbK (DUF882 family)
MSVASKNFDWKEFECKCGCGTKFVSQKAIEALQRVRDIVGVPLVVTSAARCPKHNWNVGGAKNSKHLSYQVRLAGKTNTVYSTAFDVQISDKADAKVLVQAAKQAGFNGIGVAKDFVHMDIRDAPAQWTY